MSKTNDCDRFDRLVEETPNYNFSDDDVAFYIEHERQCPLGRHTISHLEDSLGLRRGTLRRRFRDADTEMIVYPQLGTVGSQVHWKLFGGQRAALFPGGAIGDTMKIEVGPLAIRLLRQSHGVRLELEGCDAQPSWRSTESKYWTRFDWDRKSKGWFYSFKPDLQSHEALVELIRSIVIGVPRDS